MHRSRGVLFRTDSFCDVSASNHPYSHCSQGRIRRRDRQKAEKRRYGDSEDFLILTVYKNQ